MVKRTVLGAVDCPVGRALDVLGDWWSLLIVRDAFDGLRRFGEFQRSLGVAKNILSVRLRNLVAHGVLEMVPASDGSAFQEYQLTAKGRDLFEVIVSLRQWGERHAFGPAEKHSVLVDKKRGKPVARLTVHAQDGRLVNSDDVEVRKLRASRR